MRSLLTKLLLLSLISAPILGNAQSFKWPSEQFMQGKPNTVLALSANNSTFLGRGVQLWNTGVGFRWETGYSLKLNYSWMSSEVFSKAYSPNGANHRFYMRYLGVATAYEFFEWGKLKTKAELLMGGGNVVQAPLFGDPVDRVRIVLLEPAIHVNYHILSWLSFSFMTGFRLGITETPMRAGDITSGKIDIGLGISPLPLLTAIKGS